MFHLLSNPVLSSFFFFFFLSARFSLLFLSFPSLSFCVCLPLPVLFPFLILSPFSQSLLVYLSIFSFPSSPSHSPPCYKHFPRVRSVSSPVASTEERATPPVASRSSQLTGKIQRIGNCNSVPMIRWGHLNRHLIQAAAQEHDA